MHSETNFSFYISTSEKSGRENCHISMLYALKSLTGENPKKELIISNFYNLEQYPEIAASISHTQNVGAALLAPIKNYPSIGIDIEFKDRKITKGAEKYFFNEHDRPGSDILRVWTLKEAAFKAISPLSHKFKWKKTLLLKHIWIKGNTFGLLGRKRVLGKFVEIEESLGPKKLLISLAFLKGL